MIGSVSELQNQLAAQKRHRDAKAREQARPTGREPLTDAHAAAEGEMAVSQESTAKAITDRGATPGPGQYPQPGHAGPQDFRRPYLDPGHAAPSPQHAAPHDFPLPAEPPGAEQFTRGYLQQGHAAPAPAVRDAGMPGAIAPSPLAEVHGTGPGAAGIAAHQARLSMSSPSLRGGQ